VDSNVFFKDRTPNLNSARNILAQLSQIVNDLMCDTPYPLDSSNKCNKLVIQDLASMSEPGAIATGFFLPPVEVR
jgi:hypothetical protein